MGEKRVMKSIFVLLSIVLVLAVAPQAHAKDEGAALPAGHHLYVSYCVLCHGEDGKSNGPLTVKMGLKPTDLTSERLHKSPDELGKIIGGSGGLKKAESKMPDWAKEIPAPVLKTIASYVLSLPTAQAKAPRDCSAKSTEDKLSRGKTLYDNACLACHGRYGDGKGLLSKLIGLHDTKGKPMVDWTSAKYTKPADAIKKATLLGQGDFMPAWKGTVCDDEADDIIAYIATLKKK